jgi:basic membrane protein A
MIKRSFGLLVLLVVFAMLVAACGAAEEAAAPEPTTAPEPTEAPAAEEAMEEEAMEEEAMEEEAMPAHRYGQITDVGGVDDKGFNQLAWTGMQQAGQELGVEVQFLESQQQTDYEKNISEFLDQGYNGLVTVGFLLADATRAASEANPDVPFAIVDFPSQTSGDMGLLFVIWPPG